ncbi:MAG: cytochrome c oxidase subunit 3 [Chloroflexota bacterium]
MSSSAVTHDDTFRAGRELGVDHLKLGVWRFLASEVMFFGGLIAAFLHYKFGPTPRQAAQLNLPLVGANTFVLLTSSFTVVLRLAAIRRGSRGGLVGFLALTVLLGAAFLAGQGYEFASLYREGVTLTSSVFGSSFFTLTGFHGLHVLIGLAWALPTLVRGVLGRYTSASCEGVEVFGLSWHFVDIVWIVLFTLIYLL